MLIFIGKPMLAFKTALKHENEPSKIVLLVVVLIVVVFIC